MGWWCDTCGEQIRDVDDGWVEWLRVDSKSELRKPDGWPWPAKGLRLVHHRIVDRRCAYDEKAEQAEGWYVNDGHLKEFIGAEGLVRLLGMSGRFKFPEGEVEQMIARLHVPGHEAARHYRPAVEAAGHYFGSTEQPFELMYPHTIERILEYVTPEGEVLEPA